MQSVYTNEVGFNTAKRYRTRTLLPWNVRIPTKIGVTFPGTEI